MHHACWPCGVRCTSRMANRLELQCAGFNPGSCRAGSLAARAASAPRQTTPSAPAAAHRHGSRASERAAPTLAHAAKSTSTSLPRPSPPVHRDRRPRFDRLSSLGQSPRFRIVRLPVGTRGSGIVSHRRILRESRSGIVTRTRREPASFHRSASPRDRYDSGHQAKPVAVQSPHAA